MAWRSAKALAAVAVLLACGCDEPSPARWPEPVLSGPGCELSCDDGVETRSLECGCEGAPCGQTLQGFLESTACALEAEVVIFPCGADASFVRVAGEGGLFVFAFRDDALVGYQMGDDDDNACRGRARYFGQRLDCPARPDAGIDGSGQDGCP